MRSHSHRPPATLPDLPKNSWPDAAAVPPIVPIVEEAASFEVVMVSVPSCASVAWRLFEASAG